MPLVLQGVLMTIVATALALCALLGVGLGLGALLGLETVADDLPFWPELKGRAGVGIILLGVLRGLWDLVTLAEYSYKVGSSKEEPKWPAN